MPVCAAQQTSRECQDAYEGVRSIGLSHSVSGRVAKFLLESAAEGRIRWLMTIENEPYVGVIDGFRVPNRHEAIRFHYAITRKAPPSILMMAGSAATEKEASDRVQEYLRRFAQHDATKKSERGSCGQ